MCRSATQWLKITSLIKVCAADLLTRGTEVAPFVNFRVHLLAQSLKKSETRQTKTRSKHIISNPPDQATKTTIKQVKWWKTFFSTFYVLGTKLAGTFYHWPFCLIIHLSWTLSAFTFQHLQGQVPTSQTFCKFTCATYQIFFLSFFLFSLRYKLHGALNTTNTPTTNALISLFRKEIRNKS